MSVSVSSVQKGLLGDKKGLKAGDILVSINQNEINDVLDYRFFTEEPKLKIEYLAGGVKKKHCVIHHAAGADSLGLTFETYLMDSHKSCKNKCIFCFIDQLPSGMRPSLYFKDDDSRLSFLFGNYITLTNLTEHDVQRIIQMHLSPINASVHTMNPELRVKMMKNPKAGESLKLLSRFSEAGIAINAQLVLCPGINDGAYLQESLEKLGELQSIQSIAAVPVGLTKYRQKLPELNPYTKDGATAVINCINRFNTVRMQKGLQRIAYASDEFYQLAEIPFPSYEEYDDFPQLDNGVGMCVSTEHDFINALSQAPESEMKRSFSIATGKAAVGLMRNLSSEFCKKYPQTSITVYPVSNRFFGERITVSGLITGRDLIDCLKQIGFHDKILYIPAVMLKSREEPVFLDDVTVSQAQTELNCRIIPLSSDGYGMVEEFLSEEK